MSYSDFVTVTTGRAADAQARLAREALHSQRARLVDLFRGFDDDNWSAPTRCTEWSVHDVVRHLADVTVRLVALLRGDSLEGVGFGVVGPGGFDPRTTPDAWLERSAGERPAETIGNFERASAQLLAQVDTLTDEGATITMPWLYGPVPWSIAVLHAFWDAWLHERDIVVPLGRAHESPDIEDRTAATYGLLMSCVPSLLLGASIDEAVVLDGPGGGTFHLAVHDRVVTVRGDEGTRDEEALRGALPDVVDSLLGRGQEIADVLHGPAERVHVLGRLRRFMLTPV